MVWVKMSASPREKSQQTTVNTFSCVLKGASFCATAGSVGWWQRPGLLVVLCYPDFQFWVAED